MLDIYQEYSNHIEEIFENSFDYIYLHDQNGNIIDVNDVIIRNLGYSKNEILSMKVTDFLVEETKSEIIDEIKNTMGTGIVNKPKNFKVRKKNGDFIFVEANIIPLKKKGKVYAILGIGQDITERKQSEQKAKISEKSFQVLFNNSTSGIAYHRIIYNQNQNPTDYIITDVNPKYEEILQIKRENVINKKSTELYQVNQAPYLDTFSGVAETGEATSFETYFSPLDKYFSISVISPKKGEFISVFDDISERKKAENKLKESEKILKDFIHNATDSISIWDSNLNLIDINKAASDPWDSPNEPEMGISMLRLAPLIKETERYDNYLKVIETGEPVSFDNIQIPPTIGERYFNIKAFKVGNGLGIIGTEITEHIRFEQELKESEEKFRTIAEQSFMGIVIVQEGKIKYMNKTMATMSEFPIEEMLKWPDKLIIKMVHPDDVGYIVKRLQSNREGTMSQLSQNYFRIINRSGEIRWLEDYTSKIIYKGKVANLISVVDVTDKKQAEQLIIEENKRLLELEVLRKDLITRVSHELKTPLTSIFGSLQILLSIFREKIDNDALKYVNIGYSGCLRLKELIENLLDSSRLESKKLELKLQMEDLALLIDDCVNDMSYLADLRKQTIDINTPYRVNFEIDRLRFRQVITNIISNAIKNTPREGKVFINLREEKEYIDIQVRDDGVGITEKEREILFEKFGKIERYGMDLDVDIEGSGLGLYISKEIVELHGGQILVLSEGRNKGTTFIIRLFKR